jgi:CHAT domain-containing protein
MGLVRSFMLAGAKTVVVSLWRVSDQSTAALMKKFYEAYALNGGDPSEALRTAELFLMDNERQSAPYYWAPFVVVGRR